jgi:hypothetical protein
VVALVQEGRVLYTIWGHLETTMVSLKWHGNEIFYHWFLHESSQFERQKNEWPYLINSSCFLLKTQQSRNLHIFAMICLPIERKLRAFIITGCRQIISSYVSNSKEDMEKEWVYLHIGGAPWVTRILEFEKIRNGTKGIMKISKEDDSWRKPDVKSHVTLSL